MNNLVSRQYSLTCAQRQQLTFPLFQYEGKKLSWEFAEELANMSPQSPQIKPEMPIDLAIALLEKQYRDELPILS